MKITIGIDNNKTIVVLPYVTTEMLTISYGDSPNENKDAVKYSQIKVMGAEPLAKRQTGIYGTRCLRGSNAICKAIS